MPGTALYCGLDLGSSGCRACVIDSEDRIVALVHEPWPPVADGMPTDPEVWRASVRILFARLCAGGRGAQMRAIAVAATSGTVYAVDGQGRLLGPALTYNDARAAAEARKIAAIAPPDCGAQGATSGLAKWLWLKRQGLPPDARVRHQADCITALLLGRDGDSDENNCLKLGYDPLQRRWPPWFEALGVTEAELPRVHPAGSTLGHIESTVAHELGMNLEVQVKAGTTDGVAAFIASGARAAGEAVTSLGSTLILKLLSPAPVFSSLHGVYSHRLGDLWLAGGASNSGGAVLRASFSPEALERLSARLDPSTTSGLDYYPLLKPGERFPICDPELPPRLAPRPPDDARYLQGLLEGIAAIERDAYRKLAELGAPPARRVLTVGGGAGNPAWLAIRRRLLGIEVVVAAHTEAAYGAARLARGLPPPQSG